MGPKKPGRPTKNVFSPNKAGSSRRVLPSQDITTGHLRPHPNPTIEPTDESESSGDKPVGCFGKKKRKRRRLRRQIVSDDDDEVTEPSALPAEGRRNRQGGRIQASGDITVGHLQGVRRRILSDDEDDYNIIPRTGSSTEQRRNSQGGRIQASDDITVGHLQRVRRRILSDDEDDSILPTTGSSTGQRRNSKGRRIQGSDDVTVGHLQGVRRRILSDDDDDDNILPATGFSTGQRRKSQGGQNQASGDITLGHLRRRHKPGRDAPTPSSRGRPSSQPQAETDEEDQWSGGEAQLGGREMHSEDMPQLFTPPRRVLRRRSQSDQETSQRRMSNALSKRMQRDLESSDERESRLEDIRSRNQTNRERLSTQERSSQRTSDRQRMSQRRAAETDEETEARQRADRVARWEERAELDDEERQQILEADRARHQQQRENETNEERHARQRADRVARREERAELDEQERQQILEADRARHQRQRENETDEQRRIRLQADARRRELNEAEGFWEAREEYIYVPEHELGPMNVNCSNCKATHFMEEVKKGKVINSRQGKFNQCCRFGSVKLPRIHIPPPLLHRLLTGQHEHSKNFFNNVRQYNAALSLASMAGQIDAPTTRGPFCYRVHGQLYRWLGPLHPVDGAVATYAQLYIFDNEMATNQRLQHNANASCVPELMQQLGEIINDVHPDAKSFKLMKQVEDEENERARLQGRELPTIFMTFDDTSKVDQRRYNRPVATTEVAAVFVSVDGTVPDNRVWSMVRQDGQINRLMHTDPRLDPMTYPVLFPCGDRGWKINMEYAEVEDRTIKGHITMREFYAYRIAIREGFSSIHRSGKLFHQYLVDAYCKVEENTLYFLRTHQRELRIENYMGLLDHLDQVAMNQDARAGRAIVLPSSFTGGPRYMQNNYQDAMSIVSKFGKPDLFLTFTCNPHWKEIKGALLPGQSPWERPDIIARVFRLKLEALMADIWQYHVLGAVKAYVYTIEFQKRGLPHCHMLITLEDRDKIRTPEEVDKIIRAEIPEEEDEEDAIPDVDSDEELPENDEREQTLRQLVLRHMIHGPCTFVSKGCWNNSTDKKCMKRFPHAFREETSMNEDGYPQYRRRRGPMELNAQNQVVPQRKNNKWVIPYNPYLLKKYNAHINLELCATVKSVKYIYKYIYKGHDCAALTLREDRENAGQQVVQVDEIKQHLDTRYVSAPEAVWRILANPMQDKSHTIIRLAVHLPLQQNVIFQDNEERDAVARAANHPTTLMAWFTLNEESAARAARGATNVQDSREFLYSEIPHHYVFKRDTSRWQTRQRHTRELGRIYTVSPSEGERFYLRLLLLHVRGATSFEDLRTYEDVEHATFQEACRARDLLRNDEEWVKCLRDADVFASPKKMRELFAIILDFCEPSDPLALWNEFKVSFMEDFVYQGRSEAAAEAMAFYLIEDQLKPAGRQKFGVIPRPILPREEAEDPTNYGEERNLGATMYKQLNPKQREVVDAILAAVHEEDDKPADQLQEPRLFFIDGPGGSGKTFIYRTLYHLLAGIHKKVCCVAWTGIASDLLPNGRTVCSHFKLSCFDKPARSESLYQSSVGASSALARLLRVTSVVIWDEAGMAPKGSLNGVHNMFKDLMKDLRLGNHHPLNNRFFGGKIIVTGGDFRQILPVIAGGNRLDIVNCSITKSPLWGHFKTYSLSKNMRAQADPDYAEFLLDIGDGEWEEDEDGLVEIPEEMLSDGNLVEEIFGDSLQTADAEQYSDRAILTPKNMDALRLNEDILRHLPGEEKIYLSIDEAMTFDNEDTTMYPPEFLHSLTPTGYPPHSLRLKVGAPIMVLRNLNSKEGLCNGTRLIIEEMMNHALGCRIALGERKGQKVVIPRIELHAQDETKLPFKLRRRQFPIRLAFCMTINKSQGQTFNRVGLFLPQPVFSHGQLYVALSRVRRVVDIKVLIYNAHGGRTANTRNVVYKEVLLRGRAEEEVGEDAQNGDDQENELPIRYQDAEEAARVQEDLQGYDDNGDQENVAVPEEEAYVTDNEEDDE